MLDRYCYVVSGVLLLVAVVLLVMGASVKNKSGGDMEQLKKARNMQIAGGVLLAVAVLCAGYGMYMRSAEASAPALYYF